MDPSKIVSRQCHAKFDSKDVQPDPMLTGKWSKYGHKNGAYFIKVAYRRNHFIENFVSRKVFTTVLKVNNFYKYYN